MKKAFGTSLFYLVFGLAFGVFYREYTKLMDFNGETALSFVHSHILTLGFALFVLIIILDKIFSFTSKKYYEGFFWLYNIGLMLTVLALIYRGILDVLGADLSFLPYIAGIGHMTIAVGFGFFMKVLIDSIRKT